MTSTNKPFIDDPAAVGLKMHELCTELYPICRSITGNGVRQTLDILSKHVDIQQFEIPSGKRVFDWTVPTEWNCDDAYIEDPDGHRIVDLKDHSLHLVSYSTEVDGVFDLETLDKHLHSLPEQPTAIPYRTSYYDDNWGFCLADELRRTLKPGDYRVRIDSKRTAGSLTYGEVFLPGRTDEEILISAHICHPSLANDNLSGIAVATFLASHFGSRLADLHYGIRIIFIPGTIGAIAWLAENSARYSNIVGGLVLSGIGDSGPLSYKKSRRGDGLIDKLLPELMMRNQIAHEIKEYIPYGYDERQFCSPGLNLPVGCLMRTPFGEYPEYHTSGDDLNFISATQLAESLSVVGQVLEAAQLERRYENLQPNCEPQLGRRGLYAAIGGDNDHKQSQMAMLWMLAYSDRKHSIRDVERMSGISITDLSLAAQRLVDAELLATLRLADE